MRVAWVIYAIAGVYRFDIHGFTIDWLAVPIGLYFLWVVAHLHQGALGDWNVTIDKPLGEAVALA